jgi:hypothetical protein
MVQKAGMVPSSLLPIRARELGTKIDFAAYGGYNAVPENIPVMNAADYRVYLSGLLKTKGMTDAQIQSEPYMNDDPANPSYYAYHNQTNWQDLVMKQSYAKKYLPESNRGR